MFSPAGFEGFLQATAVAAPDNAVLQLSRLQLPFGMSMNSPLNTGFVSVD
jgi:hypothetical protein